MLDPKLLKTNRLLLDSHNGSGMSGFAPTGFASYCRASFRGFPCFSVPFAMRFASLRFLMGSFFSAFYHCFSSFSARTTHFSRESPRSRGLSSQADSPALTSCLTNLSIHILVNKFKLLMKNLFILENLQKIKIAPRSTCGANFYRLKKNQKT